MNRNFMENSNLERPICAPMWCIKFFKRSKSASISSLFSTFYESFVAILWVFCIAFMSFLLYFFEFFSFYEFFVVFFEFFVIFFWVFFLFQHFPTTQWVFWPNLPNLYKKIVSFLSPMSFFANAEIDQKSKQVGPIRALQKCQEIQIGRYLSKNGRNNIPQISSPPPPPHS